MIDVQIESHISHYPLKKKVVDLKLPAVPAVGDDILVGNYMYRVTHRRFTQGSSQVRLLVATGYYVSGTDIEHLTC